MRELPGFLWDETSQRYYKAPPTRAAQAILPIPVTARRPDSAPKTKKHRTGGPFSQNPAATLHQPHQEDTEGRRNQTLFRDYFNLVSLKDLSCLGQPVLYRRKLLEQGIALQHTKRNTKQRARLTAACESISYAVSTAMAVFPSSVPGQGDWILTGGTGIGHGAARTPRLSLWPSDVHIDVRGAEGEPITTRHLNPSRPTISAIAGTSFPSAALLLAAASHDGISRGALDVSLVDPTDRRRDVYASRAALALNALPTDVALSGDAGWALVAQSESLDLLRITVTPTTHAVDLQPGRAAWRAGLSDVLSAAFLRDPADTAPVALGGLRNGAVALVDPRDPSHHLGARAKGKGGARTTPPSHPVGQCSSAVCRIAPVAAEGPYFVTGAWDGSVALFDVRKPSRPGRWAPDPLIEFWTGRENFLFQPRPAVTAGGDLVTCTCGDGRVRIWSVRTGRRIQDVSVVDPAGGRGGADAAKDWANMLPAALVSTSGRPGGRVDLDASPNPTCTRLVVALGASILSDVW